MNNQLHSWRSVIITDTKEKARLLAKMHCYKYELQFNSFDPITEDKLAQFQLQLNNVFETIIKE
jgi:DNA-binding MarR family transcriptional regulator